MANHPLMNVTPTQSLWDSALWPRRTDAPGPQTAELQPIRGVLLKLLYERYGVLENPFGVTPNPRYLYQSKTHAEARSSLIIGIECGIGFQALIAPPGMGKTTMLFHVLERFKDVARTALLFQIQGHSHDFLRYLLLELGSDAPDSSVGRLQEAINQLLVREFLSGRRTIVVIDEAQSLDIPILETIRLLSNFETRSEKLLQIILAGQPQLAQRLATAELAQLHQRISIQTTLIPFDLEDTRNYIEHRLRVAGYPGPPLFTPAAVRAIWERSGGVPREINTLCFNALLLAAAVERKQVDSKIVHEVVADLDLNPIPFNKDTAPRGIREMQTADMLQLASLIDASCRLIRDRIDVVPGAKAKEDDASTSDGVDLVQLGTTVAERGLAGC
jgi:general secretion pathway protein A